MLSAPNSPAESGSHLDALDRAAVGYLAIPLIIFVAGWFKWWAALPLIACTAYALVPLFAGQPAGAPRRAAVTSLQLGVALTVACVWTVFGGTGHLVFANPDWHVRDAVLHDLVDSGWPVGYGLFDGKETLLRAPLAYFLPAALVGKGLGLTAAHFAMAAWTAIGAMLFLLQVFSLTASRIRICLLVAAVIVLFSGLDIVGALLDDGPRFRADWKMTTHLEWWAGDYQYSSMTTQLFWVPNHALGGWLTIGLLYRHDRLAQLGALLPILLVIAALWSPLTAIGLVPFVLWKAATRIPAQLLRKLLRPAVWAPALIVGLAIAAYFALDPGGIPKGVGFDNRAAAYDSVDLLRQAQFFLLEAGFLGFAILAIRPSVDVILALAILAVLPIVYFGPGNDLVMRASIPSLAVLAIRACLALSEESADQRGVAKKTLLGGLLAIGAVTPAAEFARAVALPAWPINLRTTLIGANCGGFAPHYVARLGGEMIAHLLREPDRIALGPQGPQSCDNPALDLMLPPRPRVNSQ